MDLDIFLFVSGNDVVIPWVVKELPSTKFSPACFVNSNDVVWGPDVAAELKIDYLFRPDLGRQKNWDISQF